MIATLKKAFTEAGQLPSDRQSVLSQWVSDFVHQETSTHTLSEAQIEEVRSCLNEPNPQFATSEQVATLFNKYGA